MIYWIAQFSDWPISSWGEIGRKWNLADAYIMARTFFARAIQTESVAVRVLEVSNGAGCEVWFRCRPSRVEK